MVHNQVRPGNIKLLVSITKEADLALRQHALRYGEKSKIINDLILKEYGTPTEKPQPAGITT